MDRDQAWLAADARFVRGWGAGAHDRGAAARPAVGEEALSAYLACGGLRSGAQITALSGAEAATLTAERLTLVSGQQLDYGLTAA